MDDKFMEVDTGEVEVAKEGTVLKALAIGSCVAVIAYDPAERVGGLAHIMIPGRAPTKEERKVKYAADALNELINRMLSLGADRKKIEMFIVGGGNVLEKEDDTIGKQNIDSVKENIERLGLELVAEEVGGTQRRSASIDIKKGVIAYSKGDSGQKILKT